MVRVPSRLRDAGFAAALVLASAGVRAEPPVCTASSRLEPPRAVPGQQVLYRVQIASRDDVEGVDWSTQLAFPGLRSEILPGLPGAAREIEGHRYAMREERRALYAEAPGRIPIRAEGLRCRLEGVDIPVRVPEAILEVEALPAEGRPEGFDGVIGPLTLYRNVSPSRLRMGESVRVAVMLRGTGNLWDAGDVYAAEDFPTAELFARRPGLHLEHGVRLFVQRRFAYDLVPREVGTLRIPPLRVRYFDPLAGHFAVAEQAELRVEVAPEATRSPQPAAAPDPREAPAQVVGEELPVGWIAAGLVALLALAVGVWRRVSRRSGAHPSPAAALAEAARAREAGDRGAEALWLARALRAGLAPRVPDAAAASAEEILARELPGDADAAAHLLVAIERARFDPAAPPPDAGAVERAIAALRRRR